MRRWIVALAAGSAACGSPGGTAPDGGGGSDPAPIDLAFRDLGAPAHVAALTFEADGRPIVFAADDLAGPYQVSRLDGSAWTVANGPSADTAGVMFLRDGANVPVAIATHGDNYDMWRLTGDAAFEWSGVSVPMPDEQGPWRFIGESARGTFYALVDAAGLTLQTWDGDHGKWATIPGYDEPGVEQGALVTPSGSIYVEYSPPGEENFTYQRVSDGPQLLQPCTPGAATVLSGDGSIDAASDVFFESCENNALFVIPVGGACYRPVVELPAGVCSLVQAAPDGTVFIEPSQHGDARIFRHLPGADGWTQYGGDIDGGDGYVARDANTLFRFGGAAVGLGEADL